MAGTRLTDLRAAETLTSPEALASAAQSVNALGLDLLARGTAADANALLSPYSIQAALAMTYAGADGETRDEMARVLHYPANEEQLHAGFAALSQALNQITRATTERAERAQSWGGSYEPVVFTVANRLFGQQDFQFRAAFLDLVKTRSGAPLQLFDFVHDFEAARTRINGWVEDTTRQRIKDLIPSGGLNADTRLVLVNAIYLKARWEEAFSERLTKPIPFHVKSGAAVDVPTMVRTAALGYAQRDGFTALTLPYASGEVQLLLLLPDATHKVAAMEARLTPALLAELGRLPKAEVALSLPKFRLEPPSLRLAQVLQSLGMKSAFDKPAGSANFDRMAPRKPNAYLALSEVFHKTFLSLDEKGTEAAAATAAVMVLAAAVSQPKPKPIEVKVDRPFVFAIQHRSSGACLFLGRVNDPR